MMPFFDEFGLCIQKLLELWICIVIEPLMLINIHDVVLRKLWSTPTRWHDLLYIVILPQIRHQFEVG